MAHGISSFAIAFGRISDMCIATSPS